MGTRQPTRSAGAGPALATMFLGTFVLGCSELLVVGVLDVLATDLGVSVSTAGALVTAYALGLAIGGPVFTALTIRLNKRTVLIGSLLLWILASLIPLLIPSYGPFLAARAVAGALDGLFIAAAFAAGGAVVPPERTGRAIAVVISGVSVSAAFGVPLGTLVGQLVGWRGAFAAITGLGVLTVVAAVALVPSVPSTGGGTGNQARHAFAPRVLAVLGLCFLVFASLFAALTYIVPFLQHVTGISGPLISVFVLAYGVATAVGSFGGGRFADQDAARTLTVATIGAAASLLALYLVGSSAFLVALVMLAWGLFAMGMAPSLQYRVVSLAGPGGGLAQSLPASAVNLGIAFGSAVGGLAIAGSTPSAAVLTGLIIAGAAVLVAWATRRLQPPVTNSEPETAPQLETVS